MGKILANIFCYQSVDYLYEMGYCSASLVQRFKSGDINYIQDIADTLSTIGPDSFVRTYNIKNLEYKRIIRIIADWKITPNSNLSKGTRPIMSERSNNSFVVKILYFEK